MGQGSAEGSRVGSRERHENEKCERRGGKGLTPRNPATTGQGTSANGSGHPGSRSFSVNRSQRVKPLLGTVQRPSRFFAKVFADSLQKYEQSSAEQSKPPARPNPPVSSRGVSVGSQSLENPLEHEAEADSWQKKYVPLGSAAAAALAVAVAAALVEAAGADAAAAAEQSSALTAAAVAAVAAVASVVVASMMRTMRKERKERRGDRG